MKSTRLRCTIQITFWLALAALLVVAGCNWWLLAANRSRIFRDAAALPNHDVALVLGTAPRVGRYGNPFFEARMDAAAKLWRERKVRHFLLSGDNGTRYYDEPTAMRDALVPRGVPAAALSLDCAGFRTLDAMVRARKVFGLEKVIVITDGWHQPRALFLAHAAGLDAIGFRTSDVLWNMSARTRLREWISRVKAVADIYALHTRPKFLGQPVHLPL